MSSVCVPRQPTPSKMQFANNRKELLLAELIFSLSRALDKSEYLVIIRDISF